MCGCFREQLVQNELVTKRSFLEHPKPLDRAKNPGSIKTLTLYDLVRLNQSHGFMSTRSCYVLSYSVLLWTHAPSKLVNINWLLSCWGKTNKGFWIYWHPEFLKHHER